MSDVYDNEYGGDGKYNPENCGEVKPPSDIAPVEETPSNEYTNNEIRDSLDSDAGVDLNDGTN